MSIIPQKGFEKSSMLIPESFYMFIPAIFRTWCYMRAIINFGVFAEIQPFDILCPKYISEKELTLRLLMDTHKSDLFQWVGFSNIHRDLTNL